MKTAGDLVASIWELVADGALQWAHPIARYEILRNQKDKLNLILPSYRSATDGVPQNGHTVAKPALVDQLQLQPHTIREEPFSGADDHWADDHLKFVGKTSP